MCSLYKDVFTMSVTGAKLPSKQKGGKCHHLNNKTVSA